MRRVSLIAVAAGLTLCIPLIGQPRGSGSAELPGATTVEPIAERPARPSAVETPRADRPGAVGARVSRIYIPRLDMAARITWDVNDGPAWWPVTGRPFGGDTIAIAGHRTTYTRPFYHLDRLRPGDEILIAWHGRTQTYEVSRTRVVPATNMHIADAVGHERLILSACAKADGSPTSGDYRFVVYANPKEER